MDENCEVKYNASCSEEIRDTSDMLCTCQATCNSQCVLKGASHSCRARVAWLESQGNTFSAALQQVNVECDTQCSCSASDFDPTTTITITTTTATDSNQSTTCDTQCVLRGDSYSCRSRVTWLQSQGNSFSAALQQVNAE